MTAVVNVVAGCVSIREARNGAAGPADHAPRFPVKKLSRTRQNDSHLGCGRSFFLRYVLFTASLEINNGGSLKHFKICSCFMRSDTQLDGGWEGNGNLRLLERTSFSTVLKFSEFCMFGFK